LNQIKRKVDQEHIEKPPTIKVRVNKIAACLFCQVNSTQLHCWFSFSYVKVCCL